MGNSCEKILREILAGNFCGKFLWAGQSCGKFLRENLTGNSWGTMLREIVAR